ncbi:MAG: gliding motility-associated C-terminal domain-containing protein [Flavobacteriales bacterium]|nr:gliding motility-associated C-terminal domain-containing protein [Flavobacteriales bacterium]
MRLRLLLFIAITFFTASSQAQVFWTEDFGTGCNQGTLANGASTANGTWTVTSTGANHAQANDFYISATEAFMGAGNCGDGCLGTGGTNKTLHVANVAGSPASILCPTGDCGAAYDATVQTNKRAESPVINCSGQSAITLSFDYMTMGEAGNDECNVWYFDGATWTAIVTPVPQTQCCGGAPCGLFVQGEWAPAAFSIALPASANNNPGVRIGFEWTNDNNNSGSDPSLAIDNVTLSGTSSGPVASFSSSDSTLCVGDCINFTDLSTGSPVAWTWYFPGAATTTSNAQNPTNICYNTAGTYNVSLVVDDGSSTDSLYMPNFITVNPPPTITASASPGTTICSGDMVTLTGGGGVSYVWSGGVTNGVPFSPGATTTYTVTGTDANGCTNTANITITVNTCSSVTAGINPSTTTICTGDSVVFTDASFGATGWTWDFDLTALGGATPPTANTQGPHTVFFNNPGTYTVQQIVTDGTNSDTTTVTITVNNCTAPTAGISMDDADGEICVNNCIDFSYDAGSGGIPTTINWTFEGGTPATYSSNDPNEVITVCWNDTTGTFNVSITASNANGSSNTSTTVVVHEKPVVNAGLDTIVIIGQNANLSAIATDTAGNPLSGGTYTWSPSGNLSCPNCQSTVVLEALQAGVYTVTYTDQYGCVVTDQVLVDVDVALNVGVPSAFSPNGDGSNDILYVKGTLVIESMRWAIYNRYGQKIFETTDKDQGWDGTHNGTEVNPGVFVYYLNVIFIGGTQQNLKGNVTLVR